MPARARFRVILYEYPFNERIRTYLRLEHLLHRLSSLLAHTAALDHHFALVTLFEIMDMVGRIDIKTDVLKDLENHKAYLSAQRGNPAIAQEALEAFAGYVENAFSTLKRQHGKPCSQLTEDDWLMSVRSRIFIPGGTCSFDLPAYHAWQEGHADARLADLSRWISHLQPLANALALLLHMLRDSGTPQMAQAQQGQFQHALPQGRQVQLIRLSLPKKMNVVPKISGNRLLISIQFMQQLAGNKSAPVADDVAFELAFCS